MALAEIPTRQSPVALVCPQDRGSIAEDPAHHADLPWLESWRSHSGAMSKRAWYPTAPSWLRPRHATNQDQKQALGDRRLGQVFFCQIVFALPCGTVDHRNAMCLGIAANAPAEAAGHPHQVGVLKRLVGPGQRPPPHAEPAGIMPHPEIAVQDDAIDAIVTAAQKVLVENAQPIRHPGSVPLRWRPPQTAPQGPLFRSPVGEKA